MTTYTWTIDRLHTLQQPVSGYVVEVFWTLTGESGQAKESIKESTKFNFDSTKQVIPFNELTEDVVVDWVQNSLDEQTIARYKENVQSKLDSVLNPIVEPSKKDLPWSAT